VQPGRQRLATSNRPGPPHQDQERRLEGVVGRVVITEDATADPEHHRPVPAQQKTEGRLSRGTPCHEPLEQLCIA
jgi:hypothetical protein